ncbi:UrcA family protein [Sphingomonas sp. HITSZ_GF]|uniref:UrcA family protein n=1 Tax=Sphingomonas sp. HITSZ_GF TaxID=3037247 RepID=UPI00240E6B39|nr:UrcA family protein [Sphingomonas sp. HITSZ_GF]MDG2534714.1 UrcA family protein [Sphingomonas sp. HITSZ_GF]
MRSILFLSLVLVGACAARGPGPEPAARVGYADLALETEAGRDALRERVDAAARSYCRDHGRDVTPQLIRNETGYCLDALRQSLAEAMPGAVRRAYYQR